ncbi:MAG: hypothetical protein V4773_23910, partial [Verrucomicrobiota bacterium]
MRTLPVLRFITGLLGICLGVASLPAQQNWQWANSLPASIQWKDVTFGNGTYVAVGDDGMIATSADGGAWTMRRMNTAQVVLNAVEFADGRFVAVGMGTETRIGAALIMTSTDGITWATNDTIANSVNAQLRDVAYGNGTWVISGFGGARFMSSTDGATWTQRAAPGTGIPGKIAFGAGRFVSTASGNTGYTSTDGITWTSVNVAPANSILEGVALLLLFRASGRGVAPRDLLANLLAGLCLMFALRGVVRDAGTA